MRSFMFRNNQETNMVFWWSSEKEWDWSSTWYTLLCKGREEGRRLGRGGFISEDNNIKVDFKGTGLEELTGLILLLIVKCRALSRVTVKCRVHKLPWVYWLWKKAQTPVQRNFAKVGGSSLLPKVGVFLQGQTESQSTRPQSPSRHVKTCHVARICLLGMSVQGAS